ncbi:MAG: hypothetical protein KatS3mg019_0175 [Fimbriimonadales bacterium]|nr:MAG: hypothetical protein KatS3mg019_0175 [Fimbriimonadales bacterium]
MPRRISIKVTPRASRNELTELPDGGFVAKVTAPPTEGAANRAVIRLLADSLDIAPSRIRLVSGVNSRNKVFEVD